MSPESRCCKCGQDFAAPTTDGLLVLEEIHHRSSLGKGEPIRGRPTHRCSDFEVYDDSGRKISEHLFAHGRLERKNAIMLNRERDGD